MAAKDTVWAYAKTVYDASGLVTLTNVRDRTATAIDDDVGTAAAASVLNLWPLYVQADFDVTDGAHVEVAARGVIAILWERGGAATSIERQKWDTIFGSGGIAEKLKSTSSRGRPGPASSSGVRSSRESDDGTLRYGWSDRKSLPPGVLPGATPLSYDD